MFISFDSAQVWWSWCKSYGSELRVRNPLCVIRFFIVVNFDMLFFHENTHTFLFQISTIFLKENLVLCIFEGKLIIFYFSKKYIVYCSWKRHFCVFSRENEILSCIFKGKCAIVYFQRKVKVCSNILGLLWRAEIYFRYLNQDEKLLLFPS